MQLSACEAFPEGDLFDQDNRPNHSPTHTVAEWFQNDNDNFETAAKEGNIAMLRYYNHLFGLLLECICPLLFPFKTITAMFVDVNAKIGCHLTFSGSCCQ